MTLVSVDRRVLNDLVSATLAAVERRISIPKMLPGTVTVNGTKVVGVVVDDPTNLEPVFCQNISGQPTVNGDRVMVLFQPPQAAFIVGFTSPLFSRRLFDYRLLGICSYAPGTDSSYTTSSTSFVDLDSTNVKVTFTAPASGTVRVTMGPIWAAAPGFEAQYWAIGSGGGSYASTKVQAGYQGSSYFERNIGALTPGTSYTFTWQYRCVASSVSIDAGPSNGALEMRVWAVD